MRIKRETKLLLLLTAIFSSGSVYANTLTPVRGEVDAFWEYAPRSGYMQIPLGGRPGTSSPNRPSFSELGIGSGSFFQVGASIDWSLLGIYGSYQYNRPKGNDVLGANLVTHGILYRAGTLVNTQTEYDLYSLGLDHRFNINDKWVVYPEIEATIWNFNYRINSALVATRRGFRQVTGRLGVGSEYSFNDWVSVRADVRTSIPGVTNLQVLTADGDLNFNLLHFTKAVTAGLFVGVGYQRINFQDSQTFPNHILLNTGPIARVGLRMVI